MILAMGKGKYALVTTIPGLFMISITFSAEYLNITTNYLPKGLYMLSFMSGILMFLTAIIFMKPSKNGMDSFIPVAKSLTGLAAFQQKQIQ